MESPCARFVLRNLPLPSRLALAAFLVCTGIGYFGALVQLHFQHASPGKLLPDGDDAANVFHGRSGASQLERILNGDEGKPFNGSGTMRQAFSTRSAGWKSAISRRAKDKKCNLLQAESELRSERDGERLAMLAWIKSGANQKDFDENRFVLPASMKNHPISKDVLDTTSEGMPAVKIASIFEARCTRCHSEAAGGQAGQVPLETWEQVHAYCEVQTSGGGMAMKKLAQTSHVHLLGFAVLYGFTGLIVTFTSYPGWLRGFLGFFPLLAQTVEIGLWWLARVDPMFARAIVVVGGAVAVGLLLQIVLSLFNMFGKAGKWTLVLMLLAACVGGVAIKFGVIDPYLVREGLSATLTD